MVVMSSSSPRPVEEEGKKKKRKEDIAASAPYFLDLKSRSVERRGEGTARMDWATLRQRQSLRNDRAGVEGGKRKRVSSVLSLQFDDVGGRGKKKGGYSRR